MSTLPLQVELDRRWAAGAEGVPALVDWLLAEVAHKGASDLHFEPRGDDMLLRWRIDGCLADAATGAGPLRANVIQRVKVLAGLLTYRTDIPQDGRITRNDANGAIDMRVSVYPAVQGEKVVVRFFQSARALRHSGDGAVEDLSALGLEANDAERLDGFLLRPQGMLLLTGPAGSGKTTTLYACLKRIVEFARGQRQVLTIEDPVERIAPGVTHTELKPASGLDYPAALKALLRQDPEVIMIGEIRDGETAQVSVQAALTGHLILSTVHAPSAPDVLLRLMHLGVEPYLIASVVSAVLEQRLVRKLCPVCKRAHEKQEFVSSGCDTCAQTGFSGRLLIAELLALEGGVRAAVLSRQESMQIMAAATATGWRGLWARGVEKVVAGQTTYAELRRVLGSV